MLKFIIAALAEILVGLFIMALHDPTPGKKYLFKMYLNFDKICFNQDKDSEAIKKGNRLVAILCAVLGVLTIINGILNTKANFTDLTNVFIFATIVIAFPVRYIYIFRKVRR